MSLFDGVTKLSRFANDNAGLEKTLRLLQALTQIIAAYLLTVTSAAPWLQARKQFALGRRYLRFLKFIDAFTVAYNAFNSSSGLLAALESGKWSCLGMYLLLESSTMLDAMGIWTTTWAAGVFVEAMKFWFYSLSLGIVVGVLQLYQLYTEPVVVSEKQTEVGEKTAQNEKVIQTMEITEREGKRSKIIKKIVVDGCDLFIPGSTTGWMVVSTANVGMLSVVSTVLAATDIWTRVQNAG